MTHNEILSEGEVTATKEISWILLTMIIKLMLSVSRL